MKKRGHSARPSRAVLLLSPLLGATLVSTAAFGPSVASAANSTAVAQAKKGLLVTSDLPAGWTTSSAGSDSPLPHAKALAACIGIPVSVLNDNSPSAKSPEFDSKNQDYSVDDEVEVYRSTKWANTQLSAIEAPKTPVCFTKMMNGSEKKALTKSVGKGTKVGTISITRDPATYGPGTTGLVMSIPASTSGVSFTVRTEVVYAVKGHESQQLTFTAAPGTFPPALAQQLTKVAIDRLP